MNTKFKLKLDFVCEILKKILLKMHHGTTTFDKYKKQQFMPKMHTRTNT
jgi:hypothetical protein